MTQGVVGKHNVPRSLRDARTRSDSSPTDFLSLNLAVNRPSGDQAIPNLTRGARGIPPDRQFLSGLGREESLRMSATVEAPRASSTFSIA